ncbi:uncharacterized protein LOC126885578 [Diabrotica virgifera virgifera]|uniref:FP protein C-terminal domain-containing protein n=1 Tax=Diabrotica virgifera virgifera TaxID=50390 RepID=A0ABM5KD59_DIAVI|nr:uncharacterized protein LOC126885578 [Diabrotica virgifera virgifera]
MCSICKGNYFHDSCAEKSGAMKGNTIKCGQCAKSEVKSDEVDFSSNKSKEISEFQKLFQKMEESMEFLSSKFDTLTVENQNALRELRDMKRENIQLKTKVSQLEKRICELEIKEFSCNLEIHGTQIKNEDPKEVLMEIANDLLSCNFNSQDVSDCFKQETKNGAIIVAKMRSRDIKTKFIKARKNRKMESNMLSCNKNKENTSKIYINEQLTFTNRNLFNIAYKLKKERKYKYCWTKNGRVYVKKSDDSEPIYIHNEDIIKTL